MKNKLIHYLTKENESLKEVLSQTQEIMKFADKDDMRAVNRILTGREKKIKEADKYQKAVVKIFDRSADEPLIKDKDVVSLKESMIRLLNQIQKLDDEINRQLTEKYSKSKGDYKKVKETGILKKGYKSYKKVLLPKIFDRKL